MRGFAQLLRRYARNKGSCMGLVVVLAMILLSIAASVVSPFDPNKINPLHALKGPTTTHPFGTDPLGRDILSRILHGGRISLTVGGVAVLISGSIGIFLGLISGYFGGRCDAIVMRAVDVLLSFPSILLALLVVSILGPGIFNVMIAVGISGIGQFARLARGSVVQVRANFYVEAARATGCPNRRIILRHILPNIFPPVLTFATVRAATSIISAASLSFLGLGAQPPAAEWGSMLSQGRNYFFSGWWVMLFPGLTILAVALSLNLIGDGLREVYDPKRKRV